MIQGKPEGDARPAVVTHHVEPLMAESSHQRHAIVCHRPLARLRMPRLVGDRCRTAVPTEIGTHDGVPSCKHWRDLVPRGVRPRMTMQEEHRRPIATAPHVQGNAANADVIFAEAIEEAHPAHVRTRTINDARTWVRARIAEERALRSTRTMSTRSSHGLWLNRAQSVTARSGDGELA